MTCHCRSTLPAVGTNERMESLSVPFKGRQTKRIPAISGVVKITEPSFRYQIRDRRDPVTARVISELRSSAEIEREPGMASHLRNSTVRYTTRMKSGGNCVS